MTEYFLHYVWQYRFFDMRELKTDQNESITILSSGFRNSDQGPDFSHARILIDGIEWHGNVEIHLKTSDWLAHHHQQDRGYDSVILHVVWEKNCEIKRTDKSPIPVLELKNKVPIEFIDKYKQFLNSGLHLPCQYFLPKLQNIFITEMFDKTLTERLIRKGKEVLILLKNNKNDREETFWQLLSRNFGFKINDEAFEALGKAIPFKLILKYNSNLLQLEALLFGQAGLLEKMIEDDYTKALQKEYQFLAHKHSLYNIRMDAHQWKFMRTRPYNFPTLRIAQLSALLYKKDRILDIFTSYCNPKEYYTVFKATVSDYWKTHYRFGEETNKTQSEISENLIHHCIINVITPYHTALYLEGTSNYNPENSTNLLEKLPAESNKITKEWNKIGIAIDNAYDSQAGIELYKEYCLKRKCLYCSIGTQVLKNENGNSTSSDPNPPFSGYHKTT